LTDTYANGAATAALTMTTFVYDLATNQIRAYVNGALISTVNQGTVSAVGSGPFKAGGYAANVGLPAGAMMDEFPSTPTR
jgi:hypothetical protein